MTIQINQKMRALVVDDSIVNRKVHQKLLSKLGVENEAVVDGKEAVEICKKRNFDLILMDLDMPVMNGVEATKKLREMGVRTFIAAVSAKLLEGNREEFVMEVGLDDFLEKPLTPHMLLSIIDNLHLFNGLTICESAQSIHSLH